MFDWLDDALCRRHPEPHVVCAGCRAWLADGERCDTCEAAPALDARAIGAVQEMMRGRLGRRGVARDVVEHLFAGAGLAAMAGYGAVTLGPRDPRTGVALGAVAVLSAWGYWRYAQRHGVDEGRGAPPGVDRLPGFGVDVSGSSGTVVVAGARDGDEVAVELWACKAAGGKRDLLERRSHTGGFTVRLADGRVVDVAAGRVRLEDLSRRRTQVVHHDAVVRVIRTAVRAGDRVELIARVRPREGEWGYRAAPTVGFVADGVARLRVLP
jgi:hypothetical protein